MPFDSMPSEISFDHLIMWLEMQSPSEEYNLYCTVSCVLGRYFAENIPEADRSGCHFGTWVDRAGEIHDSSLDNDDMHQILSPRPHTFGAVLQRAKALRDAR